jgi:hypothetical protein
MTTLRTITLAAAFIAGATSLALAQDGRAYGNGMPPSDYKGPGGMPSYPMGSTAANAARSGGSGAHQSAQKTGSAENDQKVLGNQNGYAYNGMPPADYKGPGGMPSYPMGGTARNAARSGGAGTHQNAQKTGSAENDQKVLGNQNGYRGERRYSHYRGKKRRHNS